MLDPVKILSLFHKFFHRCGKLGQTKAHSSTALPLYRVRLRGIQSEVRSEEKYGEI